MLPSVLSGSIMKLADHPAERMAERTNLPPEALAKLRALLGKTDSKHIPKGDQHLRMPDGSSAVLKDIGKRHVVATFYSRNMTPPGRDMRMSLSMRNTRPIFDKAKENKEKVAAGLRGRLTTEVEQHGKNFVSRLMYGDRLIGRIHLQSNGSVAGSYIDPAFRGMGLGKKLYGETIRRMPGQTLVSDSMVSPDARRVWHSLAKNPAYRVTEMPQGPVAYFPRYDASLPPKSAITSDLARQQFEPQRLSPRDLVGHRVLNASTPFTPAAKPANSVVSEPLLAANPPGFFDRVRGLFVRNKNKVAYVKSAGIPDLNVLAPKWQNRGHTQAAMDAHTRDLQRALATGDSALVDKEAADLLMILATHVKQNALTPTLRTRLSKSKQYAASPRLAMKKTASEKRRRRSIPEDAVVYSAIPDVDSVMEHGLLSSHALNARPDLLEIARPDPEKREAWKKRLASEMRRVHRKGPNVFFTLPDPDKIGPQHYINKDNLKTVEVALGQLMKDQPATRVYGLELVQHGTEGKRKGYLSHKKLRELLAANPKELWKHYDDPTGRYYAANVPHGAVITNNGVISPKYLKHKTAAEKKPYRHRAEVYIHDGKGNVLANKTDSGWQFPAGGIEGKDTPERTAKREVLEEAGYRIVNPRSFGAKPAPAKWPEWYRDIARAKGRDNYAGQVTHMLVAELGKKDKRLFDKEGDGLHSLQLVPLRQVIADHEMIVRDPKHSHHVFRKATLPGLKKLHKQLSGGQTR